MKKIIIGICGTISVIIVLSCIVILLYCNGIKAVSDDNNIILFEVKEGSKFYTISDDLYKKGLIKSKFWYKVYLKLNKVSSIKPGRYKLKKSMTVSEIIDKLSQNTTDPNVINITFKEGNNFNDIIDIISSNTNNTEDDIMKLLDNDEYLDSLIEKYWFITEEVKNDKLYYALEGYLYPDTYQFKNKDVDVEIIFNTLINQMDKKLSAYKEKIENSNYTVHEILTLASIVELEGVSKEERNSIAGVFNNRLKSNMNLGSDVTTYYGAKVRMSERDLYTSELNEDNGYNTRVVQMSGKLPIGPICNPSIESIKASLYPEENDYYYFVSDKNKKTYFTKTLNEHNEKIQELKKAGLWYEYK